MSDESSKMPGMSRYAALLVVVAAATAGVTALLLNVFERKSEGRIHLRTWERGVEGETLACGSGAVAAAFAARQEGAAEELAVIPASGVRLRVSLPGPREQPQAAVVTGDARVIFEGTLGADAARGFEVS